MKRLIEYTILCGCEHFAVNYNYCLCANKHVAIAGPSKACPLCGAEVIEQYTRIVGYYTPVSAWNKGRRQEHGRRVFVNDSVLLNKQKEVADVNTRPNHACHKGDHTEPELKGIANSAHVTQDQPHILP